MRGCIKRSIALYRHKVYLPLVSGTVPDTCKQGRDEGGWLPGGVMLAYAPASGRSTRTVFAYQCALQLLPRQLPLSATQAVLTVVRGATGHASSQGAGTHHAGSQHPLETPYIILCFMLLCRMPRLLIVRSLRGYAACPGRRRHALCSIWNPYACRVCLFGLCCALPRLRINANKCSSTSTPGLA